MINKHLIMAWNCERTTTKAVTFVSSTRWIIELEVFLCQFPSWKANAPFVLGDRGLNSGKANNPSHNTMRYAEIRNYIRNLFFYLF